MFTFLLFYFEICVQACFDFDLLPVFSHHYDYPNWFQLYLIPAAYLIPAPFPLTLPDCQCCLSLSCSLFDGLLCLIICIFFYLLLLPCLLCLPQSAYCVFFFVLLPHLLLLHLGPLCISHYSKDRFYIIQGSFPLFPCWP